MHGSPHLKDLLPGWCGEGKIYETRPTASIFENSTVNDTSIESPNGSLVKGKGIGTGNIWWQPELGEG